MKPTIGIIGLSGQSIMLKTDHFHQKGETIVADTLHVEPGGKGYNQAIAAARLGAHVRYLSCIGNDIEGKQCVVRISNEKVDARWVRSSIRTACAIVLTDFSGENQVTVFQGASSVLSASDIYLQESWLAECNALLLQFECPMETLEAAMNIALKHHIPLFLNPAPAREIPTRWLTHFDWIIPNEREACQLFGLDKGFDTRLLKIAMQNHGVKQLLVTMGGNGALLVTPEQTRHWASQRLHPVDTTGAGDTFCSAFTLRVIEGAKVEEAVSFAMSAAAYSVCRPYVLDSLPRRGTF